MTDITRRDALKTLAAATTLPLLAQADEPARKSALERIRCKAWVGNGPNMEFRDVADVLAGAKLRSCGGDFPAFLSNIAHLTSPTTGTPTCKNNQAGGSGYTGGYLVTPETNDRLLAYAAEESVLRPLVKSVQMMERTENYQELGVGLVARDMVGIFVAVPELRDDPEVLDLIVTSLFATSTGWQYDYSALLGTGQHQPQGMLTSPAALNIENDGQVCEWHLATMMAKLAPSSYKTAVWFSHPSNRPDITAISEPHVTWVMPGRPFPGIILGRPLYFTEKLPKGGLALLDPQAYLIGERSVQVECGPVYPTGGTGCGSYFYGNVAWQWEPEASDYQPKQPEPPAKELVTWRMVHRWDGQPLVRAPQVLADGWTTSPYVTNAKQ